MTKIAKAASFLFLWMLICPGNFSKAQTTAFEIFKPLTGKVWEGHYVDSEDSVYTHHVEWHYLLGSRAVKEVKIVDELDFLMETYYYYDWKNNKIGFLALLNKDMVSKGEVIADGSVIKLTGLNYFKGGSKEFRKTFQLDENGVLTDIYYGKKGDEWYCGHVIEYR